MADYSTYYRYKDGSIRGGSSISNSPTTAGEELNTNAYNNRYEITSPYNVIDLKIGGYKDTSESWSGVENAPIGLPTGGHFQVFEGDNDKTIHYVVSADDTVSDACFSARSASLVVVNGVAEEWKYLAQGDTQDFSKIGVASEYDQGRATRLDHKVYTADFIDDNATLNRGSKSGKVDFNKLILSGDYDVNWGSGSKNTPVTTNNRGRLRVGGTGCVVFQEYYPYETGELLFRERSEQKVWTPWQVSMVGTTRQGDKVKVPAKWWQGRPSGFEWVETYDANTIDEKANYTAGPGIYISPEKVISYTGSAGGGIEEDPTVPSWVKSISSAQVSSWDTAFGWGNHAGLYAPLSRQLTVSGTAGRVAVTGGTQSLAASRTWGIDLEAIHAGLSAGSSTQVATPVVDPYGRVTSMLATPIAFPVTGVSGGVLSLSSGIISLSATAFDSRYSLLGHTHTWSDIGGKPTTIAGYGITNAYTTAQVDSLISGIRQVPVSGTTAQYLRGDSSWQTLITTVVPEGTNLYYTDARARGAISGTGLLSYNSTTGAMSLSSVPWGNVTGAPSFITQAYTTVQSNGTSRTQRGTLNFSSEFTASDNAGSARTDIAISSVDYSKITNTPDFAGLYVPIVRQLTVAGTTGRVAVTGGTQSLAASRTWAVDLEAIHAGLSGGSGITTPAINVDVYGRVTSLSYSTILFPVTSVNSKTGAVVLSTDDVAEGVTNQYWTNARGDARYVQLSGAYANPSWITSLAYGKLTGVPSFLTQAYTTVQADTLPVAQRSNLNFSPEFGIADSSASNRTTISIASLAFSKLSGLPTTLAGYGITNAYTKSEVDALIPTPGMSGSGTANKVAKFTGSASVGNSQITDDGSSVTVGSSTNVGILNVGGAIFAAGNASAVSYYVQASGAIRSFGSMYLDSAGGNMFFRTGSGYTNALTLNTTGQVVFPSYTSASAFAGTRVALLGVSSSGAVITISPTDYAYSIHGHDIGSITGLQLALDAKTPWGHNHDDRYYTKPQLNTAGAGGIIHWANLTGIPNLSYDGHDHNVIYYTKGEVNGLLSGKADSAHNHNDLYYTKGEVIGFLGGKADWGHNHDDRYYTESESDGRYLQSESDPYGLDSHWFSVSGSTVTHGMQRRNGSQVYASFNVPSSGGNYLDKGSGASNTIYSYNVFEYVTRFTSTVQCDVGVYMNGVLFNFSGAQNSGSTPSISNDVIPVTLNGVTRYILLKA